MLKNVLFSILFISNLALMSFVNHKLHVDVYKIDIKKSSLEWEAEKLTGKHSGSIEFADGEIKNNHGQLSGNFDINMATIINKDIEQAGSRAKLENHMKSADFFDVAKYPKATFQITEITSLQMTKEGDNSHQVKGMLTIKDKTNEISFPAKLSMQANQMNCVGTATVDRTKFDIRYRSKSYFPDIGDKMIYDNFTLKFNVVAVK